jgi:uncharacterized membrane protein
MRIKEIDLARGFTVFIMAPVHSVLMYSTPEVKHGMLGMVLAFLAEGPGAPLFMMLMGISFTFSTRNSINSVLGRSLNLFCLAYLLNLFKLVIPYYLGWIPSQLLKDFGIHSGVTAFGQLFGLGDILQFAAISLVIMALVFSMRDYPVCAILLVLAVMIISPLLWGLTCHCSFAGYVAGLLWGRVPTAFFPVFPWLVYPLTGLIIGYYIRQGRLIGWGMAAIGAGVLLLGCIAREIPGLLGSLDFYHMGSADTAIHIGIALMWLFLCRLCILNIRPNPFFRGLYYMSRHITRIYILQWILIFWLMGLIGYQKLGLVPSIFCMLLVNGFVIGLSLVCDRIVTGMQEHLLKPLTNPDLNGR